MGLRDVVFRTINGMYRSGYTIQDCQTVLHEITESVERELFEDAPAASLIIPSEKNQCFVFCTTCCTSYRKEVPTISGIPREYDCPGCGASRHIYLDMSSEPMAAKLLYPYVGHRRSGAPPARGSYGEHFASPDLMDRYVSSEPSTYKSILLRDDSTSDRLLSGEGLSKVIRVMDNPGDIRTHDFPLFYASAEFIKKYNDANNEQLEDVFLDEDRNIRLVRMLGKGEYGKVFQCVAPNGNSYAVKIGKCGTAEGTAATPATATATSVLTIKTGQFLLSSEFLMCRSAERIAGPDAKIIKAVDFTGLYIRKRDGGRFIRAALFMPLFGTTINYVYTILPRQSSDDGRLHFIKQMLLSVLPTLQKLHEQSFIHGDIKPDNIILQHKFDRTVTPAELIRYAQTAHIFDFTLSHIGSSRDLIMCNEYRAPENWPPSSQTGPATDVWGLGCTCIEILTGGKVHTDEEISVYRSNFSGCDALGSLSRARFPDETSEAHLIHLGKQFNQRNHDFFGPISDGGSKYALSDFLSLQRDTPQRKRFFEMLAGMMQMNPAKRWTCKQILEFLEGSQKKR